MTTIAQTYPQLAGQLAKTGWGSEELSLVRSAWDLAASLFAGAERGSGKPFIDHLIGTASGVLVGGGNAEVVAAALLHAAYDQGDFGDGRTGPSDSHRARISAVVGAEVENLVCRYHQLRWDPGVVADAVSAAGEMEADERSVLLVRVANEIDDVLDGAHILSGKVSRPLHTSAVHELVAELAGQIGTPELASIGRREFFADGRTFPQELIIGTVSSTVRLPASSCHRPNVWARRAAARGHRVLERWLGRIRGERRR